MSIRPLTVAAAWTLVLVFWWPDAATGNDVRLWLTERNTVIVSWTSSTEGLGFNILRSSNPDSLFQRINGALIDGVPRGWLEFEDKEVRVGRWYWYIVEQVDRAGYREYLNEHPLAIMTGPIRLVSWGRVKVEAGRL